MHSSTYLTIYMYLSIHPFYNPEILSTIIPDLHPFMNLSIKSVNE